MKSLAEVTFVMSAHPFGTDQPTTAQTRFPVILSASLNRTIKPIRAVIASQGRRKHSGPVEAMSPHCSIDSECLSARSRSRHRVL